MSISTREIIGKAVLETLEARQMFSSVSLVNGALLVQGTSNTPNNISVHTADNKVWAVTDAGASPKIAVSSVRQIRIIGGEKGDDIQVDSAVKIPVYVRTGAGDDSITTGSGNDTIFSGNGRDRIESGAGNDRINAGNGNDTVVSGGGNDRIDGGNGSDIIDDGPGNDVDNAQSGDDTVYSGSGHDKILLGVGHDHAMGVSTMDHVTSNPQDVIVDASSGVGDNSPTPGDGGSGDGSSGGTTDGGGDQGTTPLTAPTASSFTLINADTDQPIAGYENMTGTVSIDLTTLPTKHLNIRANYDPSFAGSVIFGYDSNADFSTENLAPYSFNHDLYGDYYAWTPKTGSHTITATAFSGADGAGTAGGVASLSLKVTQSAVVDPTQPTNPTTPTDPTGPTNPVIITTPTPTQGTGAPVGAISLMQTSIDVDHAIQVNAISSNMNGGTLLTAKVIWDFGDPGSQYNQLVGWNAAHQYAQPGKYTITLTLTNEDGKTSVTKATINVAASSRKVIYVSNDGSDSASGLSPQSAVRTFAKAMSMVTSNTEVLFNSGDTFDVAKGASISGTDVVISSYGTGAKPILYWNGPTGFNSVFTTTPSAKDVTIQNLTFNSNATNLEERNSPTAVAAGGTNISVVGNTFLNIDYGVNTNQKPSGLLVQGNNSPGIEDLRAYLVYCQGSDLVIIGNTVANSTREHCIRVDGTNRILIAYNNLTNIDNRPNDPIDTAKQTITVHSGTYAYVYGNTTHDGYVEIGPLGNIDGMKPSNINLTLSWVRVENNDFTFNEENRLQVRFGTSHLMIDDNRISVVNGAGIAIQSAAKYTPFPEYGAKTVTDATVTGDNVFAGASPNISVGQGDVDTNVLKGAAPVYSPAYKLVA